MDTSPAAAFGIGFASVGLAISLLNWLCFFESWRTGKFHSAVPLLGGGLIFLGLLLIPGCRIWAPLGLLVDYGTLGAIPSLPWLASELWNTSRWNLVAEYAASTDKKKVTLKLFRKGNFTIEQEFLLPPGTCGLLRCGTSGTYQRGNNWLRLSDGIGHPVDIETSPEGPLMTFRLTGEFSAYRDHPQLALSGLEFRRRGIVEEHA